MPDLSSTVLLRIQTDQSALARVNQDISKLRSNLGDVATATSSLNAAAKQGTSGLNSIRDSATGADKAVQSLRDSLQDTQDKINLRSVGRGLSETGFLADRLGAPGIGGGLRVGGEAASAVGNLGPILETVTKNIESFGHTLQDTGGVVGGLADVGAKLGPSLLGVSAGFGSVLAVAAPVALAVGAFIVVFEQFQESMKAGQEAVQQASAQLDDYYQAYGKYTTQEAQDKIDQLQQDKANADAHAANLKQILDSAAKQTTEGTAGTLNSIIDGIIGGIVPGAAAFRPAEQATTKYIQDTAKLTDQYNKATEESKQLDAQINALNDVIAAGGTQAKDAAEAVKQYNASIEAGIQDQVKTASLIRSATSKQIEDQIAGIEDQKKAITDYLNSTSRSDSETEKLGIQLGNLEDQENNLTNNVLPLVQAREAETAAIKKFTDGFQDFLNTSAKILDNAEKYNDETQKVNEKRQLEDSRALQDFNTKQATDTSDFRTKLNREDADYATSRLDKLNKLYAEVGQIDAKAQQEQLQDITDLSRQETKISQDTVDAIAKINRDAEETELDAESRLDARAVAQAERQRKKQIEDTNSAAEKQKQQLETETKQKIEDLQKSAEDERNQRLAAGLQQIQDEDAQRATQRQREIEDFNTKEGREKQQFIKEEQRRTQDRALEDKDRYQAFIKEQTALIGHFAQLSVIQTNGQNIIQAAWSAFFGNLKAGIPGAATPTTTATASPFVNTGTVTTSQFQAASAAMPDAYSNLLAPTVNAITSYSSPLSAPTITTSQFQSGGPDAYSNLLSYRTPLADGMDFVPRDNYPASLHFGEAVLNRHDAEIWRGMMGRGNNTSNTTNNAIHINGQRASRADKSYVRGLIEQVLEEELS